jgi:uncharacterized protein
MAAEALQAEHVENDLWAQGYARLGRLLSNEACDELRAVYSAEAPFRSTIEMQRYRFGRGEYRYFKYPLPERVQSLREQLYELLVPTARNWMKALGMTTHYPGTLRAYLRSCRTAGQGRPTPLLLRYRSTDFNCLHQDVYGALVFPFQVIAGLSAPQEEYQGGELLLVEQRPRAQSIGHALRIEKGEAIAITTRYRPVRGTKGFYRANIRHGVSQVTEGERFTLGIIFHDAA